MASYVFPLPGWSGQIELHHGTDQGASDLFAPIGTPVVSMTSGTVTNVGVNDALGGNNVSIHGDDGLDYYFAHFVNPPMVRPQDRVTPGSRLGAVGITGNAAGTEPHLHIGIGHGIASGAGPHGGAGDNFNAVAFLRQVYSGGTTAGGVPPGSQSGNGNDTTNTGTDLGTTGANIGASVGGALLQQILSAFSGLLRGKQ